MRRQTRHHERQEQRRAQPTYRRHSLDYRREVERRVSFMFIGWMRASLRGCRYFTSYAPMAHLTFCGRGVPSMSNMTGDVVTWSMQQLTGVGRPFAFALPPGS